ncbi:MAG: methyltransferase domain-containing protein [Pseudomonadota bacterium]|jgi:Ribosomal protein L11 methylase|nr:MAG: SAM-dependent methyltransferase [Pseudomonadota bacterium]
MKPRIAALALVASIGLSTSPAVLAQAAEPARKMPEVPFVPSPDEVVNKMLDVARVGKNDVVYDLGSGDGRIVIAAAKRGARAVGVDIDPERIKESTANAKEAGVEDRVRFLNQDLFDTDLSEATVVTLYLLPRVNLRLRPKLLRELKPGARIVSHSFDMGEWEADREEKVEGRTVYLWIVPKDKEALMRKLEQSSDSE